MQNFGPCMHGDQYLGQSNYKMVESGYPSQRFVLSVNVARVRCTCAVFIGNFLFNRNKYDTDCHNCNHIFVAVNFVRLQAYCLFCLSV